VKHPAVGDALLIHELYARYSWALDTGNTEDYVPLFHPTATVYETTASGVDEATGHDAIRAFVLRFHRNPEFPGRQHRISQIVIDPDPEGRPRWTANGGSPSVRSGPGRESNSRALPAIGDVPTSLTEDADGQAEMRLRDRRRLEVVLVHPVRPEGAKVAEGAL
jgi:SnoaL-like protein